jgi:membrane protease YdiL (CAAX protease family)
MRFNLPEPRMVTEARGQTYWGNDLPQPLSLIIETLIFIVVFFVSGMLLNTIFFALATIPLLLSNKDFLSFITAAAANGQSTPDLAASMMTAEQIAQTPAMDIASLFATLGTIVGVIIYCRAIERRRLATLGFRRGHTLREYLVGALIGFVLFSLTLGLCVITGTMSYEGVVLGSASLIVLFFLGFMVQGLSEELLCRGYFMVSLARKQSLVVAIIVSSSFFGVLHLLNPGVAPLAIVNIFLFGCFMAVYLLKRGNIWGAAAIHSVWNFAQGNIFGTSVSGLEKMESVFAFSSVPGGELINGGAFGVEGGLAATLVLTAALIVALLLKSQNPTPQVVPLSDGTTQVAVIPGAQPLPAPTPLPAPEARPKPGGAGNNWPPPSGPPTPPPSSS